jgi:hypothetical protein
MLNPTGREPTALDVSRGLKWDKMISEWPRYNSTKAAKLSRRIRKGIPDAKRRTAWNTITGEFTEGHPGHGSL